MTPIKAQNIAPTTIIRPTTLIGVPPLVLPLIVFRAAWYRPVFILISGPPITYTQIGDVSARFFQCSALLHFSSCAQRDCFSLSCFDFLLTWQKCRQAEALSYPTVYSPKVFI